MQGVTFYTSQEACIASSYSSAQWLDWTVSFVKSCYNYLIWIFQKGMNILFGAGEHTLVSSNHLNANPSKKRLVVCLHGLNDHPSQFNPLARELEGKELSATALYIPRVLEKGNAPLQEMVKPILEQIRKWSEGSLEKELVLVGISNGGRIARAVETEIALSPKMSQAISKLRFISIVGANKGSSLVNLANRVGLSCILSSSISKEMPVGSETFEEMEKRWQEGLSAPIERDYTFIAASHDWTVPDFDSTLMKVEGMKARYALFSNHGHNSIVSASAKLVADAIFT